MPRKPKTIASLKRELDKVFASYIRQRDSIGETFTCISCGQTKPKAQMHAGHFISRVHTALRWNENNVHGQCIACNTFLHGNLLNYRRGLIRAYGEVIVNFLEENQHQEKKLDREELEEQIRHYKTKIKP